MRIVSFFLFLVHSGVALAGAQTSATLTGRVVDASQAPIPGVTITARHGDRAVERFTVTGADGRFVLAALPVAASCPAIPVTAITCPPHSSSP